MAIRRLYRLLVWLGGIGMIVRTPTAAQLTPPAQSTAAPAQSTAPPATSAPFVPTSAYGVRTLHGWRLYIAPDLLRGDARRLLQDTIRLLDQKLREIGRGVPKDPLRELRTYPIWIERAGRFPTAMVSHVSAEWLRDNGFNPDKAPGIEVVDPEKFIRWTREDQPMMVLHELAHVYHDRVIGRSDAGVLNAFRHAVDTGIYEDVPYIHGRRFRAYALTNDTEYFAELTEAYFGRNDYYPFDRDGLRSFDPPGYALMEKVWRVGTRP